MSQRDRIAAELGMAAVVLTVALLLLATWLWAMVQTVIAFVDSVSARAAMSALGASAATSAAVWGSLESLTWAYATSRDRGPATTAREAARSWHGLGLLLAFGIAGTVLALNWSLVQAVIGITPVVVAVLGLLFIMLLGLGSMRSDQVANGWHDPVPLELARLIGPFVRGWIDDVIFTTVPADRHAAERALAARYRALGHEPPALVMWCDSPAQLSLARRYITAFLSEVRDEPVLTAKVRSRAWRKVAAKVPDGDPALRGRIASSVAAQADRWSPQTEQSPPFPTTVGDWARQDMSRIDVRVANGVTATIRTFAEAMAWQLGEDGVSEHSTAIVLGAMLSESMQLNAVRAFRMDELGRRLTRAESASVEIARTCGGALILHGAAIMLERPVEVHLDEQRRPHREDGPALRWRDGWEIWAIEGVAVGCESVLDRDSISAADIAIETDHRRRRLLLDRFGQDRYRAALLADSSLLQQESTSVRRQLIEEYGITRFVQERGQVIARDTDGLGHPRRLWRALRPGDDPITLVEVTNSTPEPDGSFRTYWLRVPPFTNSCQAAVAWTFGIERADEYALVAES